MADELRMTEYERRRLENIKRNVNKISSLNINSILSNLSSSSSISFKRTREWQKKTYERSRSSLRTQGIPPPYPSGLLPDLKPRIPLSNTGPITMKSVYMSDQESSHCSFVNNMRAVEINAVTTNVGRVAVKEPVKHESLTLKSENVTKVVPCQLSVIRFLPTSDATVIVAGNRTGFLGVWEVNSLDTYESRQSLHLYRPHSSYIYGISVHPFSPTKMYSCCSDGLLRLMNIEREEFDLIYSSSSGHAIYSLAQPPTDANSIYIGEGQGIVNMYDGRAGKIVNSWVLHGERINSIDFNPANPNVIATSSTDTLACLWDLRKMNNQPSMCEAFRAFTLDKSIHSAYFSPSGGSLALTCLGHKVAVLRGADFEEAHIIRRDHFLNTGSTCSRGSRAIWGWDDTYLYMASKKRRVEVLSVHNQETISTLESSCVPGVPYQFDAHPCKVGILVGAIFGGKVFLWTSPDY